MDKYSCKPYTYVHTSKYTLTYNNGKGQVITGKPGNFFLAKRKNLAWLGLIGSA